MVQITFLGTPTFILSHMHVLRLIIQTALCHKEVATDHLLKDPGKAGLKSSTWIDLCLNKDKHSVSCYAMKIIEYLRFFWRAFTLPLKNTTINKPIQYGRYQFPFSQGWRGEVKESGSYWIVTLFLGRILGSFKLHLVFCSQIPHPSPLNWRWPEMMALSWHHVVPAIHVFFLPMIFATWLCHILLTSVCLTLWDAQ